MLHPDSSRLLDNSVRVAQRGLDQPQCLSARRLRRNPDEVRTQDLSLLCTKRCPANPQTLVFCMTVLSVNVLVLVFFTQRYIAPLDMSCRAMGWNIYLVKCSVEITLGRHKKIISQDLFFYVFYFMVFLASKIKMHWRWILSYQPGMDGYFL